MLGDPAVPLSPKAIAARIQGAGTPVSVPEPTSVLLMLAGIGMLAATRDPRRAPRQLIDLPSPGQKKGGRSFFSYQCGAQTSTESHAFSVNSQALARHCCSGSGGID
jgi:hypothetical protein